MNIKKKLISSVSSFESLTKIPEGCQVTVFYCYWIYAKGYDRFGMITNEGAYYSNQQIVDFIHENKLDDVVNQDRENKNLIRGVFSFVMEGTYEHPKKRGRICSRVRNLELLF